MMRGTLLLIAGLLALVLLVTFTEGKNVPAKDQEQGEEDHVPFTHDHEIHEEDEEGSLDSGSGASGSGKQTEMLHI